jgi:2-dehydro-3-deoxyphosphooctonate aldolase (KDO 8-P synthase)
MTKIKSVTIRDGITFGESAPFVLISGPCVIESEEHTFHMAREIKKITSKLGIPFIFKASFDKANRTRLQNYRGVSIEEASRIFSRIRTELDIPVTTDIHEPWQADVLKDSIDLIQIPAFLCRQTDLLVASAKTNLPINIKKAQFVNGVDMERAVNKVVLSGNDNVLLTERGNTFGYGDYVVDMRNLVTMRYYTPVIFDATHSVQKGCSGGSSGSNRHFIEPLAKAAVAVGVDGLFLEVHDDPDNALSDGTSSIKLSDLEVMLNNICKVIG